MHARTFVGMALISAVGLVMAEAPMGGPSKMKRKEKKAFEEFKGKLEGKIVWSTSRSNTKHDIWIMNADGTDKKQLTESEKVDWFSRFSPDGNTVLFVRSKMGWVPEGDAEINEKWELWTIGIDGSDEKKVADNACWGTWRPSGKEIVFARGPKVVVKNLETESEEVIFDAEESIKKKTYSQQPELSPNGEYLAITLRGTTRETGIWDRENEEWNSTGGGCQINWFPRGGRVLRMNEGMGNGGTEVLAIKVEDGKPTQPIRGLRVPKELKFMDLPGRRSHEYFPKLDQSGKWMVWCATQRGHEHDLYDYEVYIWNIDTDKKEDFVRLTFHSGNDRWPDVYTGAPEAAAAEEEASAEEEAADDESADEAGAEEDGAEENAGEEGEEKAADEGE